jgi:hypothetical protein
MSLVYGPDVRFHQYSCGLYRLGSQGLTRVPAECYRYFQVVLLCFL